MIPLRFFMMLTSNDHRPKQPEMPRSHAIKTVPKTEVTYPHSHYREESFRTQSVSCRILLQRTNAQNFMGTTQNLAGSRVIFYSPRQKLSIYLWLTWNPQILIRCWQPWWGWRNLQLKQARHVTCDQQLYRVAVQISWDQPATFKDMYFRLSGMHALMSIVGAIGSLMTESGLFDVLSEVYVFGGIAKMQSGKKFPQNVRALRMMAEEVIRSLFMNHHFRTADDMMKALDQIATDSRTVKLGWDLGQACIANDDIYQGWTWGWLASLLGNFPKEATLSLCSRSCELC